MGIAIHVERPRDHTPIEQKEWQAFVDSDAQLRKRVEPYQVMNPATKAIIKLPAGEADSELYIGDQWVAFLAFRKGRLTTNYSKELENPNDPRRMKIVEIALHFEAQIRTDVDDAPLGW